MNKIARFGMLIVGLAAGVILTITSIFALTNKFSEAYAQGSAAVVEPNAPVAVSQVLSYQGRLLTPGTGEPKPDSTYQLTFSIYDAATGGALLWTETKSVLTVNGEFATLLGDTTPLILGNFNGQELFLGVKVGDDPEAIPRQRLAHSAYAIWAETAGTANIATSATNAAHAATADNAGTLDGIDSTAFAATNHTHTTLPIAFGYINANGTKGSGTSNVSSSFDAANQWYRITISGENYTFSSYATVVTPISSSGCGNASTSVNSVGGNLLVSIYNAAGTALIQCPFQFVTFKP